MNSKTDRATAARTDSGRMVDEKLGLLGERFMALFVVVCAIATFLTLIRIQQFGVSTSAVLLSVSMAALTILLIVRKSLPNGVLLYAIYLLTFFLSVLAFYRFGLITPAISFLAVMPLVLSSIRGTAHGVFFASGVCILIIVFAGLFSFWEFRSEIDVITYMQMPNNWAIMLLFYGVSVFWGLAVIGMQRKFWLTAIEELHTENLRRQESDAALDSADQRWRELGAITPGIICDYVRYPDRSHNITRMSVGIKNLLGIPHQEIEGNIALLESRALPAVLAQLNQSLDVSEEHMTGWSERIVLNHVDGREVWLQLNGNPVRQEDGSICWHCIGLDVTREVEADREAQLQSSLLANIQRQESIGQLSGGVAHDFNNPLAVILGNLELLKEDITQKKLNKKAAISQIDAGISSAIRGADLTRKMLSFARQADLNPTVFDLNELIRKSQTWIERTIPANIHIETKPAPDLWKIHTDENSTDSALLNLILNARDAMPGGGSITIETTNVRVSSDQKQIGPEAMEPGCYVLLKVSDTGTGISADDLKRIFEPFFSTKGPTMGSGLGLPMVQGFVKQSGGYVQVHTDPNSGTSFELYFRAHIGAVTTSVQPEKTSSVTEVLDRAILVAEDEPGVLEIVVTVLEKAGYVVVSAQTGDEAYERFENQPDIDLLITDEIMPGELQGTNLARLIRAKVPDLPVVFLSGYANRAEDKKGKPGPKDVQLTKPVRKADLLMAVEKALKTSA